ncbi:MerR family transcriptional regulator [Compostibacillus humi]|uniref:MerR family transcriptional regulator n=1 Tax=Compostibacillus humi TaxID=1245525 RepID=A0A8J2XIT6_9BACI|nr:MerR family transcriptional regulator [Compostibacillus humi]GFZ83904.1 MerR family transcriptional regulator [Compostibacillus humi]
MEYTVKELAQLAGVSSRTLRYYDQIGLLKPARMNESGYRIYSSQEVDILQQILFYRELGVPLEQIKEIIHDPAFDEEKALQHHYEQVKQERDRLDKILATIEKTLISKKGGKEMQDKEKFEGLKDKLMQENEEKYGKEIREKYGEETVKKSYEKFRNMSEEDFKKMQAIEQEVFALMKKVAETKDPTSADARKLAEKHKEWLMFSWPDYSKEAHQGLAEMYVADELFSAYYDKVVAGGAKILRDAIVHYVNQ